MTSIRRRLLLWLIIPLTAVAVIVSIETFVSAQKISNDLHDKTLLAAMLTISENVVASNGTLLAEQTLKVLTENLGDEFFYHVLGPNGAFVTGYSGYPRLPEDIKLEDGVPIFYDGTYQGNTVRVTTMRQLLSGRDLNGWTTITTWQETTQRADLTLSLFGRSLIRLAALVIAAGVIVWFAVTQGLQPLRQLQQAIDSRTPLDLTPIKRQMPIELKGIVASMNDLFARVARSKANRERFIGDAAHQLRNPIAALKVQAEVALQAKDGKARNQSLKQVVNVSDQTSELVSQMLTNARANAIEKDAGETFDLSELTRDAARSVAPKAIEKDQDFSTEVTEGIWLKGDKVLIREAIANLIDNAVKYSPRQAKVSISLVLNGDEISIGISDDGELISDEEFFQYCQPFYTDDSAHSGSGLGLAIAKDVSANHGGYLVNRADGDGRGKTISIILPKPK
ncbi:MAG: sensor histidine kinase [Lentilitoribacter sp.]